ILGHDRIDSRLTRTGAAALLEPPQNAEKNVLVEPAVKDPVIEIAKQYSRALQEGKPKTVLHLYGPRGVGKRELALEICFRLEVPLLYLDASCLTAPGVASEILAQAAFRESILLGAVIYIDHCDLLLPQEPATRSLAGVFSRLLEEYEPLTILAGEKPWSFGDLFKNAVLHSTHLPIPPVSLRQIAWENHLQGYVGENVSLWAAQLASRFRLTPGQTRDAVQFAYYHFVAGSGGEQPTLTIEQLTSACRRQSDQKLAELAVKSETGYTWDDLILDQEKKSTLNHICSQVKHSHQVFDLWGFGTKLSHGKGLSVLFSGPPGTGKTMAAGIMARELELDMYKIDLFRIVSKYIGETEKNL
ncbi:MAG: ATP-binding protein, partial [Candidatus Aminicenantes bacterium]|nr:ATP-binding protein [Candidatus Aminicenantes bacterium]